MTKLERIEALEIALKYEIKTILSWWNPFQNVQCTVLKSHKKLTNEQYYYLSKKKFLEVKSEPKKDEGYYHKFMYEKDKIKKLILIEYGKN